MKINFLTYDALPTNRAATSRKVGGLNVIVFHLSRALAELLEIDVRVTCCCQSVGRRQFDSLGKVKVNGIVPNDSFVQSNPEEYAARNADLLRRYFLKSKPDVVHTSGSEAGFVMAKVRHSGLSIPWIHTNYATLGVRRVMVERLPIAKALSDNTAQRELLSLKQCDRIIALSEVDRREICEIFGVDMSKVSVSLPGVDHRVFTPGRSRGREHLVLSAGRMSKIKDFSFLLRAFQLVIERECATAPRLVIIGGNQAEREELNLPAQIKLLGLEQHVSFLDGMGQALLAQYLQRAKVFAGSSRHETFGLLPLEARACGTPSVVRKNSSYASLAPNGYGGYIVDNDSEKDMADKIARILSLDDVRWEKVSHEAVESTRRYSWAAMAQSCADVYRDEVEKSQKL